VLDCPGSDASVVRRAAISSGTTPAWESDPVAVLRRWEDAGALWRVLDMRQDVAVIGLFTCDGGEETGRFRCAPDAVAGLLERDRDDGDPGSAG
jgi:hypothetical protein